MFEALKSFTANHRWIVLVSQVLAGVATLATLIALGLQVWQMDETELANARSQDALAFARLENLRGTSTNAANDWSVEQMAKGGVHMASLDWRDLDLRDGTIGDCEHVHEDPNDADHSSVEINGMYIECISIGSNSIFREAVIEHTVFSDVVMKGVDFSQTGLDLVTFEDSRLDGVTFPTEYTLMKLTFVDSQLIGADFSGATFQSGRHPSRGPVFTDTVLWAADFRGTNIHFAGNPAQFETACIDETSVVRVGAGYPADEIEQIVPSPLHSCMCASLDRDLSRDFTRETAGRRAHSACVSMPKLMERARVETSE